MLKRLNVKLLMVLSFIALVAGCGPKKDSIVIKEYPVFTGSNLYMYATGSYRQYMTSGILSLPILPVPYKGKGYIHITKLNDLTPVEYSEQLNKGVPGVNKVTKCSKHKNSDGTYTVSSEKCAFMKRWKFYEWEHDPSGGTDDYIVTFNLHLFQYYVHSDLENWGMKDADRGRLIKEISLELSKSSSRIAEAENKFNLISKEPFFDDKSGFMSEEEKAKVIKKYSPHVRQFPHGEAVYTQTWTGTNPKLADKILSGLKNSLSSNDNLYIGDIKPDCRSYRMSPEQLRKPYSIGYSCLPVVDKATGRTMQQYSTTVYFKRFENLMPLYLTLSDRRIRVVKDGYNVRIINKTKGFVEIKQISLYYSRSDMSKSSIPYQFDWSQTRGALSPESSSDISNEFWKLFNSIDNNFRTYDLTKDLASKINLRVGFAVRYTINGKEYVLFEKKKIKLMDIINGAI